MLSKLTLPYELYKYFMNNPKSLKMLQMLKLNTHDT